MFNLTFKLPEIAQPKNSLNVLCFRDLSGNFCFPPYIDGRLSLSNEMVAPLANFCFLSLMQMAFLQLT